MDINTVDEKLITLSQRISVPLARFALFIIYFWFGVLKVMGLSPAGPIVAELHAQTISFIPFSSFYIAFALFECLIGILFLIKGAERIVIPLLFIHLFTTALPLAFLPHYVWSTWFVPTLEGQYIIKNFALIAAAIAIASRLRPLKTIH